METKNFEGNTKSRAAVITANTNHFHFICKTENRKISCATVQVKERERKPRILMVTPKIKQT